ncbi:HalOD1 output domain-containing protein [Halosolutus amylolyticus]|uniref:HalOD1 output domain-containing protein n=1 Tax=Halosolutus amylolyticus TaxID=2932267 RepID=A0ABD5PS88_9EURY|nr:HalOD1 output domain-containing protein [Halosolutus amylolyticus]
MPADTPFYVLLEDGPPLGGQIVQAVSTVVDEGREELAPLQETVDPEVLETIVRERSTRFVSIVYEGVQVTVLNGTRLVVRDPDSIHAALTGVSNVLVPTTERSEVCTELLTPYPPAWENVLVISFDDPSVHLEGRPAETGIVTVGGFTRSASTSASEPVRTDTGPDPPSIAAVEDPTDLATLESVITDQLSAWATNDNRTVVCFHSLSELLGHVDWTTGRRFLEALARKISAADAIAHYHVDVGACPGVDLDALESIVDATVERDETGLRVRDS